MSALAITAHHPNWGMWDTAGSLPAPEGQKHARINPVILPQTRLPVKTPVAMLQQAIGKPVMVIISQTRTVA